MTIQFPSSGAKRKFIWYIDGAAAAGNGLGPIYHLGSSLDPGVPEANAKTGPVGSAYTFDIQTADTPGGAWTSIFSALPSIAAGAQVSTPGTLNLTSIPSGKYVRYCVTAAGATPAQSVTIQLGAD